MLHPANIPAALSPLWQELPDALDRAAIDAIVRLRCRISHQCGWNPHGSYSISAGSVTLCRRAAMTCGDAWQHR